MPSVLYQNIARLPRTLSRTYNSQDSITETWIARFDEEVFDPVDAYILMRDYSTNPLPEEGSIYNFLTAPHLFAKSYQCQPLKAEDSFEFWTCTVTYGIAEPGDDPQEQDVPPDQRAPVIDIQFRETDYPILEAENLDALPHGGGKGANRPAGTVGPLVNGVGRPFDVPLFDTETTGVITIKRYFATLGEIFNLNSSYKRSTNSDDVGGFAKETLKYLLTESLGQYKESDNATYYEGMTQIEILDSTIKKVPNEGYAHWDSETSAVKESDSKEPLPLNLDGTLATGSAGSSIRYRYLNRTAYTPLFS